MGNDTPAYYSGYNDCTIGITSRDSIWLPTNLCISTLIGFNGREVKSSVVFLLASVVGIYQMD